MTQEQDSLHSHFAWMRGLFEHYSGVARSENPYPVNTPEAVVWDRGWQAPGCTCRVLKASSAGPEEPVECPLCQVSRGED